jgi:hypothetical protein
MNNQPSVLELFAGGGTIGVYEPASKTKVVGVKLVVEF